MMKSYSPKITRLVSAPLNVLMFSVLSVATYADQQIQDDLVVVGSICVGLDCVSGEAFNFDTLRLKENNLRIKFQDTSGSGSFPSNDWQITINDSVNGGLNKFSIDDIDGSNTPFTIEAGAPDTSIYVDSSGFLGLGTSTPVLELHLKASNSPALRFEQDISGGFTAQTWDVGGNETNFFIRDITNSSTLPFRVFPGAPSDSLSISASGAVVLGQITAKDYYGSNALLDLAGASGANPILGIDAAADTQFSSLAFSVASTDKWQLSARANVDSGASATTDRFAFFNAASEEVLTIQQSGSLFIGDSSGGNNNTTHAIEVANGAHLTAGGVWTNASSRELKDNIADLSANSAISTLAALKPVTFSYKREPEESYAGFIAEDVPDLVATNDRKSLAPMDIVAVLTKVLQEQQKLIADLNNRIVHLEQVDAQ
ncbi:MAG: hypothetical protein COA42_12475 [Alteromonadaceae bacterium]|nr:MAG: hypothetical protein COA42_12475 [Alteromonadaceae bacterium]